MTHIMRIDEMIQNDISYFYVRSSDNWGDDYRWEVVVKINNSKEDDQLTDMFYDNSNTRYEFFIEKELDNEDFSVFGKPITFQYFRKAYKEQCHGMNTLHKYMEKTPVGQMYENDMYWSEELRDEMIQLSDDRVIWRVNRDSEIDIEEWNIFCDSLRDEFKKIYNTDIYMLGRSGRHICVENTLENKIRFQEMKDTVKKMQDTLVNEFSDK